MHVFSKYVRLYAPKVHSSSFIQLEGEIIMNGIDFPPVPYRTFLLDKDNKVQLIGSPINNLEMWNLYKRLITRPQ